MRHGLVWKRIFGIALILAAALTLAASMPIACTAYATYKEARLDPVPASQAEQAAILRALLDAGAFNGGAPPPLPPEPGEAEVVRTPGSVVLLERTFTPCAPDEGHGLGGLNCSRYTELITTPYDPHIPVKLRRELLLANEQPSAMSDPHSARIRMVKPEEITSLAGEGDWWARFHARYPGAGTLAEVSRAVLAPDRKHALIYSSIKCGSQCASGSLYYLRLSDDRWKIEIRSGLWDI